MIVRLALHEKLMKKKSLVQVLVFQYQGKGAGGIQGNRLIVPTFALPRLPLACYYDAREVCEFASLRVCESASLQVMRVNCKSHLFQ